MARYELTDAECKIIAFLSRFSISLTGTAGASKPAATLGWRQERSRACSRRARRRSGR